MTAIGKSPPKKLLVQVREIMRLKHYARETEKNYVSWIRRFILYHGKRHPKDMGDREVEGFLTHLAVNKKVAASTQNQAFSALLFLYRNVLDQPLEESIQAIRARRPQRVPTVLTREEARQVIDAMTGTPQLVIKILYGSGLRLMECLRLRVKDIDFSAPHIIVRDGKGSKDRRTVLPASTEEPLRYHLLEAGYDIRTVQELLGHKDVSTTMIYTHLDSGEKRLFEIKS